MKSASSYLDPLLPSLWLAIWALLMCPGVSKGQTCDLPLLSSFKVPTTSGISIDWLDFNIDPLAYEIEIGLKGFMPTQLPSFTSTVPSFTIDGLEPGKSYEVYIRTQCEINDFSEWNGPYFFNTIIDNESACGLDFEISDSRCPFPDEFGIEISGYPNLIMGRDVVLESVELLVNHSWPPDLSIELESPYGESITLSQHNGNGTDDYGDVTKPDCSGAILFSDNACSSIDEVSPPFLGILKPEASLSGLYSEQSPDGTWILKICDRASGDLGKLNYVKLVFSESACIVPPSFNVIDVEADNITVTWKNEFGCQNLELAYKKKGDPDQLSFSEIVLCSREEFTIPNLSSDQDYELVVTAMCDPNSTSPESCVYEYKTICENSQLVENFNAMDSCLIACDANCYIRGVWKNSSANRADWIVHEGSTQSRFTGPEDDVGGAGQYVYIENPEANCLGSDEIILISECLSKPIVADCALTFNYHMYGRDIGKLEVAYSVDSIRWTPIFTVEGDQGEFWKLANLNLTDNFERGLIRFRVMKKVAGGSRADIAIDNIKLIGMDTIAPLLVYVDADGDGFGDAGSELLICTDIDTGQSFVAGDCNDNDASVFPGAPEIKCNQIDENCNGPADDSDTVDIGYLIGDIVSESCVGQENGSAVIQAINGQGPYQYDWSNGYSGRSLSQVGTGVYFCTITDVGGCQLVTDPIFIDFVKILVYSVKERDDPSCAGARDGHIELLLEGGTPPYLVSWNNGKQGSRIFSLENGDYVATISDAENCSLVIDSLTLTGPTIVNGGIVRLRDNDCKGDSTGFIQLGVLGGTPPYDIKWSTGSTSNIINGLSAGNYSVTITDQNNCIDVINPITIAEPAALAVALSNVEQINCNGESESLIDIAVTGGMAPYSFFWSDGSRSQDLINKSAGSYQVTISDVNSCMMVSEVFEITQPEPITITLDSVTHVNCAGSSNGFLSVEVNGGNGPYAYNWSTQDGIDSLGNQQKNLSPGIYSVTVSDAFDCKSKPVFLEVLNRDIPISTQLEIVEPIDCYGDSTGIILCRSGNGLLPFDYNWSSGSKNVSMLRVDTLKALIAGQYNLTITDMEGCIGISDSIELDQASEIKVGLLGKLDNLCSDGNAGLLEISIEGGAEPYEVDWTIGQGAVLGNLSNGTYQAIITDGKDCNALSPIFNISSPDPLEVSFEIVEPTGGANNGSIKALCTGGITPYQYQWSPVPGATEEIASLSTGAYSLTITDDNKCLLDTTIVLRSTSTSSLLDTYPLQIYPNPTSGVVHIEYEDSSEQLVLSALVTTQGVPVHYNYQFIDENKLRLELTDLPAGIYFLQLFIKGTEVVRKIYLY